jgi:hypothetical protein
MSVDVTCEVEIGRPRSEVAAFMFDPRNDAKWTSGVVACEPLTPGRLRAGSRVRRTAKFLGRRFDYEYEAVAADDDRSVELRVRDPFPMQISYQLDDIHGGTRARIRARGDAGLFFRLATPLLGVMVRRNISKDLALLKQRLEAR